jgi:hypothetical protein
MLRPVVWLLIASDQSITVVHLHFKIVRPRANEGPELSFHTVYVRLIVIGNDDSIQRVHVRTYMDATTTYHLNLTL